MGSTVFPAPSAGKTRYFQTLTSGTSWTVPAGVTYVNVTLIGGGGGNPGTSAASGANSPQGGQGSVVSSIVNTTPGAGITYAIGAGGTGGGAGLNNGSAGGTTTFTGATSAAGGGGGATYQFPGSAGANYRGAGNGPGITANGTNSYTGPAGGSGCIEIEYWA